LTATGTAGTINGESTFQYDGTTYTATINNAAAKLGVGDFSSGSPLYLGHFKSNAANNAYVLIQADDDPRIAGVLFKTEDTDTDVRIKGGIFFDNTASDIWGKGDFKIAINNAASNTNVSVSDVRVGISDSSITSYVELNMNTNAISNVTDLSMNGKLDGAGTADIVNFNEINANVKNFDIVHPVKGEPWRLQYSSLEGPESGVYLRGKTNDKVIELPDYWTGLVYEESITVQLTSIGSSCVHFVEKIEDNKVFIDCEDGKPNCYYLIQAKRKDIDGPKLEYIKE